MPSATDGGQKFSNFFIEWKNVENTDWKDLIQGLRDGDPVACNEFWNQYGSMLQNLAQKQLSERLQRRVGSDDVVQSACRTFFRRMSDGQFDLPDSDSLWRLMCAITVTKARRAARDNTRQKRGLQAEQYIDAATDESGGFQIEGSSPVPAEEIELADQMEFLLARLSPQECQVFDLRMQNYTNPEIAATLKCSERTVRRITGQIKTRWTALFDESFN